MAPHVAEGRAAAGSRAWSPRRPGPEADPALLVEDEVTIAIQVNGKLRDTTRAQRARAKEALEKWPWRRRTVQRSSTAAPRKVIVGPTGWSNVVA